MHLNTGLVLAAMVLGAGACKKNDLTQGSNGFDSGTTIPVTAPGHASIAVEPWKVPSGARVTEENVDATSLGVNVTAHLVERVLKTEADDARLVKHLLVLESPGGAIVADVTAEVFTQDGAEAIKAFPGETDVTIPPLSPPRPFLEKDAIPPLDFKGPLLFLAHLESKVEKRDVAIAQDGSTIAVWTMNTVSDSIDVPPEWEQTGTIKLAPGAKVTAASVASAKAITPSAAASAAARKGHWQPAPGNGTR